MPRMYFAFSKILTKHLRFFAEYILSIKIREITFKKRIQIQAKTTYIRTLVVREIDDALSDLEGFESNFSQQK